MSDIEIAVTVSDNKPKDYKELEKELSLLMKKYNTIVHVLSF